MFLEFFKITSSAVAQIFLLGAIGFFLVKRNILGEGGLVTLSRLVIEVTLPILIFYQLTKNFSFSLYPNWWVFPLISIAITVLGLVIGLIFIGFFKGQQKKMQFLSLIAFQNSGYLPLTLVAAMLPEDKSTPMFIYIFLFLLGFNLVMWSVGVYMLTFSKLKRFELGSFFSPPVIATIFSLICVFFGLNKLMPEMLIHPFKMIGECTLPLAIFVVGGNLALIRLDKVDKKAITILSLVKLVIMPLLGILLIAKFNLPELIGLLIIIQLAVPSATSLSVILTHYKKEDILISQGVFFSHILSIVTLPIFLGLYFMLVMLK